MRATERLFTISMLLGMDHVGTDLSLADEIPGSGVSELPYSEAVKFLKGRVPVTKKEWNDLEPKLRFRAFTVARLSSYEAIERARQSLISSMENGTGLAKAWEDLDQYGGYPYYWETVYRTNIQTDYNAGRRIQIDKVKPDALEIVVIEDARTSDICRPLRGLVLPYDHPFWKSAWPPFHFNCRTTVRAVFKEERDTFAKAINPTMKTLRRKFKPQAGFGGNPVDSGSYWMMLPDMFNRGLATGAITELNVMGNAIADFGKVWNGYKRSRSKAGGWVDIHQDASKYPEYGENRQVARTLAADGRKVKMLPIHQRSGWKNPDYLIDGELWELETPAAITASAIDRAIRQGGHQAPNIVLHITGEIDDALLRKTIKNRVTRKDSESPLRKLAVLIAGKLETWTAEQIRAWK